MFYLSLATKRVADLSESSERSRYNANTKKDFSKHKNQLKSRRHKTNTKKESKEKKENKQHPSSNNNFLKRISSKLSSIMGCQQSKPILQELARINEKLDSMESRLGSINSRLDSIDGVKGKESSKKFTVVLHGPYGEICHGLVVEIQNELGTSWSWFILTTSHCAPAIIDHPTVTVRFVSNSELSFPCTNLKVFTSLDYWKTGYKDISAIQFSIDDDAKREIFEGLAKEELIIDTSDPLTTDYFGRSSTIAFRGNPFCYENGRVGLNTPSQPGCSGSPLFSEKGELRSVLHGYSKHKKARHVSSSTDDISPFVYADVYQDLRPLLHWSNDLVKCFDCLEVEEIEGYGQELRLDCDFKNVSREARTFYLEVKKTLRVDDNALVVSARLNGDSVQIFTIDGLCDKLDNERRRRLEAELERRRLEAERDPSVLEAERDPSVLEWADSISRALESGHLMAVTAPELTN